MDHESESGEVQRDSLYYFRSVTFLVENSLFNVPRVYFEKNSSVFDDMLGLPASDDPEGSSDINPIKLESIQKIDFQRLMTAMFPDLSRFTPQPVTMDREGWSSVLKLATMWGFGELREEALEELGRVEMEPTDKIILGRNYKVENFLVDGYMELVARDDMLTSEEKIKLGYETSVLLYEKREDTFRRGLSQPRYNSGYYATNGTRVFDNLEAEIREMFREELTDAKYGGNAMAEPTIASTEGLPTRKVPVRKKTKRRRK